MAASPHNDAVEPPQSTRLELPVGDPGRVVCRVDGGERVVGDLLEHAAGIAERLPAATAVLNLCADRYRFLVVFVAALSRGLPTLLPPSDAPGVLEDLLDRHPDAVRVGDRPGGYPKRRSRGPADLVVADPLPRGRGERVAPAPDALAAVGYTSGSSGPPKEHRKTWGSFCASTERNAALLVEHVGAGARILATVPSQHMYGMETAVLLPLRSEFSIHHARPFFPGDIIAQLAGMPAPRVLVSTPVHLRALAESASQLLPLECIVSATAPLSASLAARLEELSGARVLELFGSTETCVLGYRETVRESTWSGYSGVHWSARPDGALVTAPWLEAPVLLQDLVECAGDGRFRLAGRASDHLEIAGKRASLAELTRRMLELPGVEDAVVFQLDEAAPVRRLAALVVAPGRTAASVLSDLRRWVDPVFLPRPLRCVDALPRNATGKLPRAALIEALNRP